MKFYDIFCLYFDHVKDYFVEIFGQYFLDAYSKIKKSINEKYLKNRVCIDVVNEEVNGFKRILRLSPPYDLRHPISKYDYGIHCMEVRYYLIRNNRAIQFLIFTPIYLPKTRKNLIRKILRYSHSTSLATFKFIGADIGYHSPTPRYAGQVFHDCNILGGKTCYYDGSSLRAEELVGKWLIWEHDFIWGALEKEWNEVFGKEEFEELLEKTKDVFNDPIATLSF